MADFKTWLHGLTSKTTPVDADELPLWDSVSTTTQKLTWANLKAALATWLASLNATWSNKTFVAPVLGTPASGNGSNITNVNAATLGGATFAAAGAVSGTTITGSGALKSTSGAIISHQNGSDLAGSGSFLQVENNAGDRTWLSQLSASNNLDWWFYGGSSFVKYMTLSSAGLAVTGALSATTTLAPGSYTTGTRPAKVLGAIIFDSTLNKMLIGGASAWEVCTSV